MNSFNIIHSSTKSTISGIPPSAPNNFSVSAKNIYATLSFNTPSDIGSSAINRYQYSLDNGTTWTAFTPLIPTTPVTITLPSYGTYVSNLLISSTYQIKMRAVNANGFGFGTPTDAISITPKSLIVYYKLDEIVSSKVKNYAYDVNGVIDASCTLNVAASSDKQLSSTNTMKFIRGSGSTGSQITLPPIKISKSEFTVSYWMFWTTNGSSNPFFSLSQGAGDKNGDLRCWEYGPFGSPITERISLWYNNGNTSSNMMAQQGPAIFLATPAWQHICFVIKANSAVFYVNATATATYTPTYTLPLNHIYPTNLLGNDTAPAHVGIIVADYYLSSFRVYDRALNSTEINELKNTPFNTTIV